MYKILASLSAVALLSGCMLLPQQTTAISGVLTQISDTAVADLQLQRQVALAATPPDIDGAQCAGTLPNAAVPGDTGTGALAIAAAIQKVAAVTTGKSVGAFTQAEILSLYQPGSEQFNWAIKTLESACIAKVHDVNQAINSTVGIITAIPSILLLAAAPVGG